jgi:hypothetical protein
MKPYFSILILMAGLESSLFANSQQTPTKSNAAFYEGESLNYVVLPPDDFKMISDEAIIDGYSFAFVPRQSSYEEADMMIGVNIYKIRGMAFEEALRQDTISVRKHYGERALIRPVDSIFTGSGEIIPTFYIDDKSRFIPNVMIAYFDGSTEMLIFELVITERVARFKAEKIFITCLKEFKALKIGELGGK